MRQALALALLLSSDVAALVVRPAVRPVAPRAASPLMNLGYQTEAAGSQGFVREAQLADDIMLLRVAANRAASENNADAQRTLLNKCEVLKASITKQIRELKAQERELTSLLRTVSNVAKSGERVIDTEFKTFLSELIRELQ